MRKFRDADAFARFLEGQITHQLGAALRRGVEDAGELIASETRAQIGQYLDGPETGLPTAPLADRTIDDRIRKGFSPDEPGLRSGDMRDSYGVRVESAGGRVSASIGSDDIKAVVFELGRLEQSNYQPPRPELTVAASRNEAKAVGAVRKLVVRALEGRAMPNARATEE